MAPWMAGACLPRARAKLFSFSYSAGHARAGQGQGLDIVVIIGSEREGPVFGGFFWWIFSVVGRVVF